jgi:hypothetical protein
MALIANVVKTLFLHNLKPANPNLKLQMILKVALTHSAHLVRHQKLQINFKLIA